MNRLRVCLFLVGWWMVAGISAVSAMQASGGESSRVKVSEVNASEVNASEVKTSRVNASEVKVSEVKASEVKPSASEIAGVASSVMSVSKVEPSTVLATKAESLSVQTSGIEAAPQPMLEIFAGAELLYRDIFFNKLFEAVVNLTPGVKWNLGHHWQLAGQVIVPVYNDYGDRYKKVRLNMAVLSKQWFFHDRHFLKVSGGLFGMERYGIDVKWMWPVTQWLAFDAQAGLTGLCSMAVDWEASEMKKFTGWLGARAYWERFNTEFRLRGGRFLYEDYGVKGEVMRHFKHCTVGVYAQYNDWEKENAGFKVVMMIPPYKRKARRVQVRPASNFRLTHNFKSQAYAMKMYTTDPEENEREGDFDRTRLRWGANCMTPDFLLKGGRK